MTALVIAGASLPGRPRCDLRIDGGRVVAIEPSIRPGPGDDVVLAGGGAVLPGLHDHHVHLRALAAAAGSVVLGPPAVRDRQELAERLRAADHDAPAGEWLRGIGYHESVAGLLGRAEIDDVVPSRPVRIQHRSGALWILNSEALRRLGELERESAGMERDASGEATGRLWRSDDRIRRGTPAVAADLASVGAAAAARGVTGFTDADPQRAPADVDDLRTAVEIGVLRQRLTLMGQVGLRFDESERLRLGPVKVILDDDRLPDLDDLRALVVAAHDERRPVAVHCVTRAQLLLTLVALDEAGAADGDRIEHGSVIPTESLADMRRLGVTVVTQPNFVHERGDQYLAEVEPHDLDLLYRARSLVTAGIPLAAGTDAPFGAPDPWLAVRAAVDRRTAGGGVVGPGEALTPADALALYLGRPDRPGTPRRVAVGVPADLCVLAVPLDVALGDPTADHVATTVVAGHVVHRQD